jgi:hypothetical protein
VDPISQAAIDFAKERKVGLKKSDGKVREMGLRVDQEGTAIYNRIEEMSSSRGRLENPEDMDVLLARSKGEMIPR